MSNYDQYMRHCGNHSKDRFYQQCSGYHGRQSYEEYLQEKEYQNAIVAYGIIELPTEKLLKKFDTWDAVFEYGKKYRNDPKKMIVYIRRSGAYQYSGRTDCIYKLLELGVI